MSLASIAFREIDSIVSTWSEKYMHHISLIQNKGNLARFMVQFSQPKPAKPIPIATVRVYFTVKVDQQQNRSITFRFEKDSLIHSVDQTIRKNQIQNWINDALDKKLLVRRTVFYLGTSYEQTRVKDQRQDKIMEQKIIIQEPQYVYINPQLLSDQKRTIQIMQKVHTQKSILLKLVKKHFNQVDIQNIGVITHPQFLKILQSLRINLKQEQKKQVLKRIDKDQTGTVQYQNYQEIVYEILEGMQAKKSADQRLSQKKQEQIFSSILTLINDASQDIQDLLITKFRAKEDQQEQSGLTNISNAKTILQEVNKQVKQKTGNQPLNPIEMAQVIKFLTQKYGYKNIPYKKIHKHIIDLKINSLSQGRINSSMTNIQFYLRQIFEPYDQKKIGKIRMDQMLQAFQKSDKIKLSKAHYYLLKNIVPVDQKGQVSYVQSSKFLAELIKKFFIYSNKKK